MSKDLTAGIVRIVKLDGSTAGTGFLVTDDGLIATCAHVVESAGAGPGDTARILFHAIGEERVAHVELAWWHASDAEDVAILRLEGSLPYGAKPVLLGSSAGIEGHILTTFGFPDAKPVEGMAGQCKVIGRTTERGHAVLQLRSSEVTPGFSGAPTLDTVTHRVVGMVTAIAAPDQYGRLTETAFITPTETLRTVCPALQASDVCPYRSLDAFTEADAEFFFGRQQVTDRLLESLRREPRFLAVLGPSGSGKSSLVQAGLIPRLRQGAVPGSDRWGVIVARPADHPFGQLAAQRLTGASRNLIGAVQTWLARHPEQERLMLIIDQFEELLVTCPENLRRAFVAQLAELLDTTPSVTVVLVMRDDFYSRFAREAPALLVWLERGLGRNVLPVLTRDELRAIVEKPAQMVGLVFEVGLVEAILEDVLASAHEREGQVGHSTILPLLEFALTQLWEWRQDGVLPHEVYSIIGGVTGGLTQWADQAYYELGKDQQMLARRVLTDLVHLGDESQGLPDSRRRRPLNMLCRDSSERDAIHEVVQHLANARLVVSRRELQSEQETVELIHDALLREWGLLQQWLQEDRHFLAWRQTLDERTRVWVESNPNDPARRDTGRLLRARELYEAERWLAERRADLQTDERVFIEASVKQEKRARRLRIGVGMFAFLVVSVLLLLSLWQWSVAETRRQEADMQRQVTLVRQLAAQSGNHLDDQVDLALLLSLEANHIAANLDIQDTDLVDVKGSLLAGLEYSPRLFTFLRRHTEYVYSVALSPDGQTLVSGSQDGTIILWNAPTGQPLGPPLTGHEAKVYSVAFSPDGRTLASGSQDGTIILWDVTTGQPLGPPLTGHEASVHSVAFSPDGQMLASGSGSRDNTIILWDVASRQRIRQPLTDHTGSVYSVAFSPDGQTLASGSNDQTIILWDVATGQPLGTPLTDHTGSVYSVAFSPDGQTLASGSSDQTIILWDVATRQPIGPPLTGHAADVYSVAFSSDSRMLASGSRDHHICLWDVARRQRLERLSGHKAPVKSVTFDKRSNVLISGGGDGAVILWNPTGRQIGRYLSHRSDPVYSVAFSPDGWTLASGGASEDDTIILWDMESRLPIGSPLTGHEAGVYSVAFSPDGQTLASGSQDGTIILWDVTTGQSLGPPLTGHEANVHSVAFSPDGRMLASGSGSRDNTIILWDVASRQRIRQPLTDHTGPVYSVAFSPDGQTLASGSSDQTIILWDVATGQSLGTPLTGHEAKVYSVAFSPDGRTLASGSQDGTIILWNVITGQPDGQPLIGHVDRVSSVAFSSDGKTLASSSLDNRIILWDVATRQQIGRSLAGHTWDVYGIAFSPDGQTLASGSRDGFIILWDLNPESWQECACRTANRNLTLEEWRQYLGEKEYGKTCPDLP